VKLQRIHYNVDNFTVSDEVLNVHADSTVAKLFVNRDLVRVAFLRADGDEIVWRRLE